MIAPTVVTPILHKPTGTIQIGNPFSLTERKLLNTLIWHAQEHDHVTDSEQTLPLSEVFQTIGWTKSKNWEDLKQAVKKLVATAVEWNELGQDRAQSWTVCTFLASGKINQSQLKYRLNPEIVSQINRPTLYAKMQLLIQGHFNKRHALILYEFFLDFVSRQQERHLVLEGVELKMIYKLLGLEDSAYAEKGGYRFFNRDILKPSLREINEYSDLEVSVKPRRRSRAVCALDFSVRRNTSFQLAFELEHKELNGEAIKTPPVKEQDSLKQQLINQGVAAKQAAQLCAKYCVERISGNLAYFRAQIEGGKNIQNPGAWLRRAIEEDYRPKVSEAQRQQAEVAKEQAAAFEARRRAKEEQEALEKEWAQFRERKVREYFANKPREWQAQQLAAFAASGKLTGPFRRAYTKDGLESPMIAALFYSSLYGILLTEPHETDFNAYQVWRLQTP
jgi:hypothetical protein